MNLRRLRYLAWCVLLVVPMASACTQPVRSTSHAALQSRQTPIRMVAVVPFTLSPSLERRRTQPGETSAAEHAQLVSHMLAEAINQRGIDVIAPTDMQRALESERTPDGKLSPRTAARIAKTEFGADAVVIGRLHRWDEREGAAAGAREAAAVGFDVTLYGAPDTHRLWNATFDERQQAWGENVLRTTQYPGGGTRWLTAEELAHWGAQQTVLSMPLY